VITQADEHGQEDNGQDVQVPHGEGGEPQRPRHADSQGDSRQRRPDQPPEEHDEEEDDPHRRDDGCNRHVPNGHGFLVGFQGGPAGDADLEAGIGTLEILHLVPDLLHGRVESVEIACLCPGICEDKQQLLVIRPEVSVVGSAPAAPCHEAIPGRQEGAGTAEPLAHGTQQREQRGKIDGCFFGFALVQLTGEETADYGAGHLPVDEREDVLQGRGSCQVAKEALSRLELLPESGQIVGERKRSPLFFSPSRLIRYRTFSIFGSCSHRWPRAVAKALAVSGFSLRMTTTTRSGRASNSCLSRFSSCSKRSPAEIRSAGFA